MCFNNILRHDKFIFSDMDNTVSEGCTFPIVLYFICEPAVGRPTSLLQTVENTPITVNVLERLHGDNLSLP